MQYSQWMTALDTKAAFEAAGLRNDNLVRTLAWACNSEKLVSTAFRQLSIGENRCGSDLRESLNVGHLWRFFDRAFRDGNNLMGQRSTLLNVDWSYCYFNYRVERSEHDERQPLDVDCFIDWHRGVASYCYTNRTGVPIQEVWNSILFDRPMVGAFIDEYLRRANANLVQDQEIDDWLRNHCQTNNSKTGWNQFKTQFGARTGKREVFMYRWRDVKGTRGRGRPQFLEQ
jgi:hypothetical protein